MSVCVGLCVCVCFDVLFIFVIMLLCKYVCSDLIWNIFFHALCVGTSFELICTYPDIPKIYLDRPRSCLDQISGGCFSMAGDV